MIFIKTLKACIFYFASQSCAFDSVGHGGCGNDFNPLRPRQNGRHFADDVFKCIFLNDNVWISLKISLKFVPKGLINNIPSLVQIMVWRQPGDEPLSEPMMVSLLMHICITRPQWVKGIISEHLLWINFISTSCDIALRWHVVVLSIVFL